MFTSFIRIVIVAIGLSPVLLSLYIVKMIRIHQQLRFFFAGNSLSDFIAGAANFVNVNGLLLIFVGVVLFAGFLMRMAEGKLPVGRIDTKSIKSSDTNFVTIIFSIVLPFFKFLTPSVGDSVYIIGFLFVGLVYCFIMKASYHFNLVMRVFFGYKHYEVATRKEVTYIVLSKEKLINPKQLTLYVYISDLMLINVSNRKKYQNAG